MNLSTAAALALSVIASTAVAAPGADRGCGAGSCAKKTALGKEAACSKKDAGCSKKDAACSKKDAACSKKDAACSKKEAACSKKDAAGKDAACGKKDAPAGASRK